MRLVIGFVLGLIAELFAWATLVVSKGELNVNFDYLRETHGDKK